MGSDGIMTPFDRRRYLGKVTIVFIWTAVRPNLTSRTLSDPKISLWPPKLILISRWPLVAIIYYGNLNNFQTV